MSATVIKLWLCSNCRLLNRPARRHCYWCQRDRMNVIGNWPSQTWFRKRLRFVRDREREEKE